MSTYIIVKWIHIVASVFLAGTGFGSYFYLLCINRAGNVQAMATVSRLVVRADTFFTAPAGFVQAGTGIWMIWYARWPLDSGWIMLSLALFALAGLCWMPVLWLQLQMRHISQQAAALQQDVPPQYWRFARAWTQLGVVAFGCMLCLYFLMVTKPF